MPAAKKKFRAIAVKRAQTGRPTLYNSDLNERAYNMALLGLTDSEMAGVFGVADKTLDDWKVRHPTFMRSINKGKVEADAHMASRLYRRGMGYEHEAVKIFMPAGAEAPVYAPYTEHYPPDTQAASLWLRNRQPAKWRDRIEVDQTTHLDPATVERQKQILGALTTLLGERAAVQIATPMVDVTPKKRGTR